MNKAPELSEGGWTWTQGETEHGSRQAPSCLICVLLFLNFNPSCRVDSEALPRRRARGLRQGQQPTEGLCDSFAELIVSGPCRIMGVTLMTKKTQPLLNFTEAQEACGLMGLTLASQDQVEEARKFGFETCR